ncbi:hypothetical protein ACFL0Q_04195 [Thermodesulfobacteriota bacterium]
MCSLLRFKEDGFEKILSQGDKIEGKHKQVTVMSCGMEGLAALR